MPPPAAVLQPMPRPAPSAVDAASPMDVDSPRASSEEARRRRAEGILTSASAHLVEWEVAQDIGLAAPPHRAASGAGRDGYSTDDATPPCYAALSSVGSAASAAGSPPASPPASPSAGRRSWSQVAAAVAGAATGTVQPAADGDGWLVVVGRSAARRERKAAAPAAAAPAAAAPAAASSPPPSPYRIAQAAAAKAAARRSPSPSPSSSSSPLLQAPRRRLPEREARHRGAPRPEEQYSAAGAAQREQRARAAVERPAK